MTTPEAEIDRLRAEIIKYGEAAVSHLAVEVKASKKIRALEARTAALEEALSRLLGICHEVIPDHIATDPDHEYGKVENIVLDILRRKA